MSIQTRNTEAGTQIALSGELTIYTVAEIRTAIAETIDAHESDDPIEVDLSGVTEIDTAGLQLLLIVKRHTDKAVRFVQHPASILRLIELANVSKVLDAAKDDHHEH